MKPTAQKPQYNSARRGGNFRGGGDGIPPPADGRGAVTMTESPFSLAKVSPVAAFFLLIHGICCVASLVIGFRISRFLFLLMISSPNSHLHLTAGGLRRGNIVPESPPPPSISGESSDLPRAIWNGAAMEGKSRVVVGRHGILIRPWPHPSPEELMKAHQILRRVQQEQRVHYGVKNPRRIIAVTPTYVRTFQALHLTGVMHSLMLVPYDVTWIVVEAGGATTDDTAALIGRSRLDIIHVPFPENMPVEWAERHHTEIRMRLHGLRIIRERKLDGLVLFMDDSNIHSTELFDEIQSVKWAGAISLGILVHPGCAGPSCPDDQEIREGDPSMPIQGPACDSSGAFLGLHPFNAHPYEGARAVYVGEQGVILPKNLEWSGFVLNSRLLWQKAEDIPNWVNDLDSVMKNEELEDPLAFFNDISHLEPVGDCGKKVSLWWLRAEARADSQFPPRWKLDSPLKITVPAKRTPRSRAVPQAKSGTPSRSSRDSNVKKPS